MKQSNNESIKNNLNIEETLNLYLKKANYYLNTLVNFIQNLEQNVYLLQSRLVKVRDNLNTLKKDYELCNKMLNEDKIEDKEYLYEVLKELNLKIQKYFEELETIITECDLLISSDEQLEDNKIKQRNLIIMNPVLRDLELFEKENCQIHIRKKIYSMLKQLKTADMISSTPYDSIQSLFTIQEFKGMTNNGAPRIFFQLINNNVIILLLGIEKTSKRNSFKESLEGRVDRNNNDYQSLIKAFILADNNPNDKSIYDNLHITNREYLNKLLESYQEKEQEFWNIFKTECYDEDDTKSK